MDLIESLPGRVPFLLVIVDLYSRFVTTYTLANKKAQTIINCIRNYLGNVGVCKYIICDNYSGFRGKEFIKFLTTHQITMPSSAPYRSRARAYVELYNGILTRAIKSLSLAEPESWADIIPVITFLLNNKLFFNENLTPSQIHYGVSLLRHDLFRPEQAKLFHSIIPPRFWELENKYQELIQQCEKEFTERRLDKTNNRREKINIKKRKSTIKVNDWVVLKDRSEVLGVSRKIKSVYISIPFIVVKTGEFNSILKNLVDGSTTLRSNNDVKVFSVLNPNDVSILNIPNEVYNILNIITEENVYDLFSNKFNENPGEKRVLRSNTKTIEYMDGEKLLDDLLDFDEDIDLSNKIVRFSDTDDVLTF